MSETLNPWDALEGPTTRTSRSLDTREHSERRRVWAPATNLPDPTPQDGYVFKWVRTASRGEADKTNYGKRLREGWEPVNASDHPELMIELGVGDTTGHVEVGGLILCKMPREMVEQRNSYYSDHTKRVTEAADDNYMRDSDERMKKVSERKRKIVFAR